MSKVLFYDIIDLIKWIWAEVTDMKRVLILNGNGIGLESFAIRSVLEYFGYIVIMCNIGRPQDYFDIFSGKQNFNYDYLIIGCHGDNGRIIVPVLGENVYYPNECRNNIGYEELRGLVKIKDKTVICTGCTTGAGELYKEFNRNNNTFVAPTDYIEGNGSLLFIVNLFYHLSKGSSFKDSFAIASAIDSETKLYNFYS